MTGDHSSALRTVGSRTRVPVRAAEATGSGLSAAAPDARSASWGAAARAAGDRHHTDGRRPGSRSRRPGRRGPRGRCRSRSARRSRTDSARTRSRATRDSSAICDAARRRPDSAAASSRRARASASCAPSVMSLPVATMKAPPCSSLHGGQGEVDDPLLAGGDEVPAGRTQRLAGRDDLVAPPPHLVGDLVVEAPPSALPERGPDRGVAVEAASLDREPVGVEDPAGGVEDPREQQGGLEEGVEPARGQRVATRGPEPQPQACRAGRQVADHLGLVLAQGRPLRRRAAGHGGRSSGRGCPSSTLPTGQQVLTRQFRAAGGAHEESLSRSRRGGGERL